MGVLATGAAASTSVEVFEAYSKKRQTLAGGAVVCGHGNGFDKCVELSTFQ